MVRERLLVCQRRPTARPMGGRHSATDAYATRYPVTWNPANTKPAAISTTLLANA